jgi:SAM-dependent methyltransferase
MDFYDPLRHTERSIRRARKVQQPYPGTKRVSPSTLVLKPERYVVIVLILALHEIRDAQERAIFLRALRDALAPGGRLIVVEHARDLANFMAYTIGFFHFLSVRSLLTAFSLGGLQISAQRRITPFVRVFSLERAW